jgi:dTMP kinase
VSRLIAIEGIDGSGKGTQAARLCAELQTAGKSCTVLTFPSYERTHFGRQIGAFLNGKFGQLDQVHPVLVSVLFAGDRLESLPHLQAALNEFEIVLCDRYVPSNLAHQAAKATGEARAELRRWVEFVEYELFKLPRAERILWLDLPVATAQQLIAKKNQRSYTDKAADLQEADANYLQQVREVYQELSDDPTWRRIAVMDGDRLRSPEEITRDLLAALEL